MQFINEIEVFSPFDRRIDRQCIEKTTGDEEIEKKIADPQVEKTVYKERLQTVPIKKTKRKITKTSQE